MLAALHDDDDNDGMLKRLICSEFDTIKEMCGKLDKSKT